MVFLMGQSKLEFMNRKLSYQDPPDNTYSLEGSLNSNKVKIRQFIVKSQDFDLEFRIQPPPGAQFECMHTYSTFFSF